MGCMQDDSQRKICVKMEVGWGKGAAWVLKHAHMLHACAPQPRVLHSVRLATQTIPRSLFYGTVYDL
jgi:hypothetical protein